MQISYIFRMLFPCKVSHKFTSIWLLNLTGFYFSNAHQLQYFTCFDCEHTSADYGGCEDLAKSVVCLSSLMDGHSRIDPRQ